MYVICIFVTYVRAYNCESLSLSSPLSLSLLRFAPSVSLCRSISFSLFSFLAGILCLSLALYPYTRSCSFVCLVWSDGTGWVSGRNAYNPIEGSKRTQDRKKNFLFDGNAQARGRQQSQLHYVLQSYIRSKHSARCFPSERTMRI